MSHNEDIIYEHFLLHKPLIWGHPHRHFFMYGYVSSYILLQLPLEIVIVCVCVNNNTHGKLNMTYRLSDHRSGVNILTIYKIT